MDCQKLSDFACKYENFTDYKEEFETFKNGTVNSIMKNEYNKLDDLPFKYINILRNLNNLIKNNNLVVKNIADPGCAYSSLSAYISKLYNVDNAYLFDFDIVSGKNILQEQTQIFQATGIRTKIHFYGGDYFSNVLNIPDNSIDLVIDGCSITHFCGNKDGSGISSWTNFCKLIYPKLVSNGYIIISTDIKDIDINDKIHTIENISGATAEFLYPNDIIKIFNENGFVLVNTPIISNDRIVLTNLHPLRVISLVFAKKI